MTYDLIEFDNAEAIAIEQVHPALASEAEGESFEVYSAAELGADGYRTGGAIQVLWIESAGRAGIMYVGSGESGKTAWTDAPTPFAATTNAA